MVATYATFAGGQFVLNLAAPTDFSLFALAAILFCGGLVSVAMTRAAQPPPVASSHLKAGELLAAAPVAVAGRFAGGLITGCFYALVPVCAESNGSSTLKSRPTWRLAVYLCRSPLASCPTPSTVASSPGWCHSPSQASP